MCARPGTICAIRAFAGSAGILSSHSCVDSIVSPSGNIIFIGVLVGRTLIIDAPGNIKCPVAPEYI